MSDNVLKNADLSGIPENGEIVVAFSGGADSMTLTHFLMNRVDKKRIICAHVNHMLRGAEADEDEIAAKNFCGQNDLRFALLRADINELALAGKMGTEECGRKVRYDFFASLAKGESDIIVTAHNANDNAETIIMNLAAGSGVSGLCGIPYRRGNIIRPLIKVTREEIEQYCAENKLPYVTDSTNSLDDYTRNRVRHHIIPEMQSINPEFFKAASRLSDIMSEIKGFMDISAEELLGNASGKFGLKIKVLNGAHPAVRKAALKRWAEEAGCGRLSAFHIDSLSGSLKNGSRIILPGGFKAECSCGYLGIIKEIQPDWEIPLNKDILTVSVDLPAGTALKAQVKTDFVTENQLKINKLLFNSCVDYDTITENLVVRNKRAGDKFMPAGRKVTKSLKKLFGEMNIPVYARNSIGVITCGEEILYVEGVGVAEKFKVTEGTERVLEIKIN